MYTSTLLLALLPAAFAQYGDGGTQPSPTTTAKGAAATTSSTSSSSTASASGATATITVGNGGLQFSPNTTTVAAGSTVEFQFYGTGIGLTHSVVQASFAEPCQSLANSTGFFSGGFTTSGTGPNSTVFVITVNDTTPIWFFCGFPTHCEMGMVGVINPPSSGNTLDAFSTAAKSVNTTVVATGVRGGIVEDASKVGSSPSTTSSSGAPASPTSSKPGAGVEARGSIQWGLLVLTGLVAAGFGGLII